MRFRSRSRPATFWEKYFWRFFDPDIWDGKYHWMEQVSPLDLDYANAPYELRSTFYESRFPLEIPK